LSHQKTLGNSTRKTGLVMILISCFWFIYEILNYIINNNITNSLNLLTILSPSVNLVLGVALLVTGEVVQSLPTKTVSLEIEELEDGFITPLTSTQQQESEFLPVKSAEDKAERFRKNTRGNIKFWSKKK